MADSSNTPLSPILTVIDGPDKGRDITVVNGELSLGRSSENDIHLMDPVLSRHHCKVRFYDGVLEIEDLDSANGTQVNGKDVKKSRLNNGDTVSIGDTTLRVSIGVQKPEGVKPQAPQIDVGEGNPSVVVDLGFDNQKGAEQGVKKPSWRPLLWGVGAVAILLVAASFIMREPNESTEAVVVKPSEPSLLPLEIEYEKVEASTGGVFRYSMVISADGTLSVEIDDMNEDRHVRKEAVLATNKIARLAKELDGSGFFHLTDRYEGIASPNVLGMLDITVILDKRVKHVTVQNRVEPEQFLSVRETLETFGKNELGIWAIQFSRDKLVELSKESLTRALNLFDQRGIDFGNTYQAIQRFKEASFYLDTIDPKPEFYSEIVTGLSNAEEELGRQYENQRFLADRAINLKDWSGAARELRVLREIIPDRDDERNIEAARKLLDVENRLKSKDK